jgi:hypothetical protein
VKAQWEAVRDGANCAIESRKFKRHVLDGIFGGIRKNRIVKI